MRIVMSRLGGLKCSPSGDVAASVVPDAGVVGGVRGPLVDKARSRPMRQGVGIPTDVRAAIVEMYRTNSAKRVATAFNVHLQTVLNLVREAGEPVRAPFKRVKRTTDATAPLAESTNRAPAQSSQEPSRLSGSLES